jgi:hypothetical protein
MDMRLERHKVYRGLTGRYVKIPDEGSGERICYCRLGWLGQILFFQLDKDRDGILTVFDLMDLQGKDAELYSGRRYEAELRRLKERVDRLYQNDDAAVLRKSRSLDPYREIDYQNIYLVDDPLYRERMRVLADHGEGIFLYGSVCSETAHHHYGDKIAAALSRYGSRKGLHFFAQWNGKRGGAML